MHCNLKAARRRASRYGLYLRMRTISQLTIKILTSPVDSATPLTQRKAIRRRSDDVITLWSRPLTLDLEGLQFIGCHVVKLCKLTEIEQSAAKLLII